MAVRFELVAGATGAPAVRDCASGEVMHPGLGPLAEAEQLYLVPARLAQRLREHGPSPLVLYDVGLGAGTNALGALRLAQLAPPGARPLEIVSFDLDPAAFAFALASDQRAALGFADDVLDAAHALLSRGLYESGRVRWRLLLGDARTLLARQAEASADVLFWDPFSPRVDADMWSEQTFRLARRACRARTTLHTYSAATATRSALLLAGFCVGLGPACSAKQKSSTCAATCLDDLARPLDWRWLASLSASQLASAHDPSLSAEARERLARLPQLARA